MDFDIKHYLNVQEDDLSEEEKAAEENWKDQFYGEVSDKPETEQKLFALQAQYLKTRDHNVWVQMFDVCYPYMRSLLLKRNIGHSFMEEDEVDSKASSATLKFMSQYLRNPKFEVGASFAGMMGWKIVEEIYGNSDDDNCISLNSHINEDGDELLDVVPVENALFHSNKTPEELAEEVPIKETLDNVLKEFDKEIDYDLRLEMLVRLYILQFLKKPRSRHAKRVFLNTFTKNYKEADILERAVLEFYNRLREQAPMAMY